LKIEFIKMQGAGNDYVYIDMIKNGYDLDFNKLAREISSRHFGVGGDGLVLIMPSEKADYRMKMYNADGSEAEMCGNAIRCVGKYLFDEGYLKKDTFKIETYIDNKELVITGKTASGKAKMLSVDMGKPILKGKEIPVDVDMNPVVGIDVMGYRGTAVSMGNPHFVIFVDRITDDQVLKDGPRIEINPIFPKKTNVEFIEVLDRQTLKMRVWERGTGETLACGTGACASTAAAVLNNFIDRSANIELRGGTLHIEWNEKTDRVILTGPAEEVFRGIYDFKL
jgi:diaminopimelate epimerase